MSLKLQNPCPALRTVLATLISIAKVCGQDEANKASLEIAYIYSQIFAAKCFGRVDLLSLIYINFLCLILEYTPMYLSTHQTLMALSHFSQAYLFPLSLPDLNVFSTYTLLLSAFLLYIANSFTSC